MRQYTDVVVPLKVMDFDMTGSHVEVTFTQGWTQIVVTDPPMVYDSEHDITTISVPLDQQETGALQVGGVDVQINYWDAGGNRSATDVKTMVVKKNYLAQVIGNV